MKIIDTNDLSTPCSVLYLSHDGMIDPLGQSQVLPYLTQLSQRGFKITLVSCEKKGRFTRNKFIIDNICQAAGIHWQPIPYSQAIPILSSVYNVFKLYRKAFQLQKTIGFSIVHCRSYVCSIVGLKLKQRFGVKFIFDTRGFWHEERLRSFRDNFLLSTIFNYFVRKEKEFIAQSDSIVTLNQTAKAEIEQRVEFDETKTNIVVIPCCVDYELFTPLPTISGSISAKNDIRRHLNIAENEIVLGYVGSVGDIYMLDEMLDFFKIMLEKVEKTRFFIITFERAQTIFDKAKQKNIPFETLIVKSATRKEVAVYLNTVDFAISFIKPLYEKRGCSPTKMGEYWAMNIPVIANDGVGDVGKIMDDIQGGVLINDFTTEAYDLGLMELLKWENKHETIREKSKKYYDLTQGVEKYLKIYTQLTKYFPK